MDARHWFEKCPERFQLEVALLRQRTNVQLHWQGHILAADDVIRVREYRFITRMKYPDAFPHVPPQVDLLSPTLPISAKVHRYTDGSLCLFHPDTWAPSLTGAWVHSRAVLWAVAMVKFLDTHYFPQPTRPRTRSL